MGVCVNKKKKEKIVNPTTKSATTETKHSKEPNIFDYRKNLDMNKFKVPIEEKKDVTPLSTSNKHDHPNHSKSLLEKSKEIETVKILKEEPTIKTNFQENLVEIPKEEPIFRTNIHDKNTNEIHEQIKNKADDIIVINNNLSENKYKDLSLENLIDDQSAKDEEIEKDFFNLRNQEYEPLYNFTDFNMTSNFEYSTENEWNQLIKKSKYHNKSLLAIKLLNLNERKWNKENILLSDIIKENRENMDSYLLVKYLNLRLKLQEHFNWIIWAISYYYYSLLLTDLNSNKCNYFTSEEFGLPPVDHIDWINGFEWKGIYVRVMPESQAKYMLEEMKALNYLFFEYVQLIDSYKFKNEEDMNKNFLSNELIFPLISYARVCSLVIVGSVTINKYSYDMSDNDEGGPLETENNINNPLPNIFVSNSEFKPGDFIKHNIKRRETLREKNPLLISSKDIKVYSSMHIINKKNGNGLINNLNESHQINDNLNNKETFLNNDISHIINQNNSFYSANVSHNINKDINLKPYSQEDLAESILLSKIEAKHLIKVIDDLYDHNNYGDNHNMTQFGTLNPNVNEGNNIAPSPKFKFMIISAAELIPNLVYKFSKKKTFVYCEDDERKPFTFINADNIPNKLNEKLKINSSSLNTSQRGVLSSELNKFIYRDLGLNRYYESSCFNTIFKIFHNKMSEKKEKNSRINEYILNIYSKQINLGVSINKLLNTYSFGKHKYLKSLLIDNKKLEINGKSLILYSISNDIKLKYSLIKSYKNKKSEYIYNENFTDNIDFLSYFDKISKILDLNLSISNIKTLKDFLHRYGINSSLEIFLLPKIKNQNISDLIKANILCKIIKILFNFHEGMNFLVKLNLINVNNTSNSLQQISENISILHNGFFDFINANSINSVHKHKISHIIKAILSPTKSKEKFLTFFYDNLNLIFFFRKLKWKYLDEYIGFNLFSEIEEEANVSSSNILMKRFNLDNFLAELISSARQKPFTFLNALEHHLNIIIDPTIKFKASIAVEQFSNTFNETHIVDTDPSITSYISCKDLSYYLFTKCIYTSRTSTKYDHFLNKVSNQQNNSETNSLYPSTKNKENNLNNLNRINYKETNELKLNTKTSKEDTNFRTDNILTTNSPNNPEIILSKQPKMFPLSSTKSKPILSSTNQNEEKFKIVDNHRKAQNSAIGTLNSNIKINSNNITKINMINNRYVDSYSKINERITNAPSLDKNKPDNDISNSYSNNKFQSEKNLFSKKEEEEFMVQRAKIWDNLSMEMDLTFPPNLYKLLFKYDEKHNTKKVNKYLKSHYSFNKIDTIKNWKSSVEMFLNDIVTVNGSELVIIQSYVLLFIHGYFIENDFSLCREILFKEKEILKNLLCYNFELMALINLFEGLIVERKNYIESEEYFSKCLIFSLMLFGDPRGRGNFGNNFMLFPLWKVARQTCILENPLTNENFKEMFHCQDFTYKLTMDVSGNGSVSGISSTPSIHYNNLYEENLNYAKRRDLLKRNRRNRSIMKKLETIPTKKTLNVSNLNISELEFDENISENESIDEDRSDTNFHLSPKMFNYSHNYKYFPFPSTSDIKTSYNTYFTSENFISFLLRNIYKLDSSFNKFDEDILNKLGLNCYSIMNSIEVSNKALIKTGSSHVSSIKKDKTAIFSFYMYDFLLDKLSYKKNHPNHVLLAWGNNSHNETTHNNYDFLTLPRICYKIKNHQIVKISSGWEHNIVITSDNKCFSWGNNESGQCGVPDNPIIYHPKFIEFKDKVSELSLGNEHTLALTETGDVYSWGKSEDGVLGFVQNDIEYFPKKIDSLKNVLSISAGSIHNLIIGQDGNVYSWGCSKGGQLGHSEKFLINIENFTGFLVNPSPIISLKNTKIKKVSCGEAHSLALTHDGKVYGWGFTSNGQLGMGICEDSFEPGLGMARCRILEPKRIEMDSNKIIDIQCGKTFSTFITEKHELLVCGINDLNQLGIEQPQSIDHLYNKSDAMYNRCCDVVHPTPIEYFLNMKVKKVACGESHCLALIEDLSNKVTTLWSWGSNRFGQLGQGNQIKKSMPKPINYILGYTNSHVVEISCGGFHSLCTISNNLSSNEDDLKQTMQIQALIRAYSIKWNIE